MLYPHSLLWHYLWVGPHLLQFCLAVVLWRRGFAKISPIFLAYIFYEAGEELTLYTMDILPSVSAMAWWRACYAGAVVEGLSKCVVVWEVLQHLTSGRVAAARLGKGLFGCAAGVLVVVAAWTAAHGAIHGRFPITFHVYILEEMIYIVATGLWLSTFLFAAFFHLRWEKSDLGISLGASISSCVHLSTFAIIANVSLARAYLADFVNMSLYHLCVLIWCYYLLSGASRGMGTNNTVADSTETKK